VLQLLNNTREEVKQKSVVAEPFHKDLYANDYFKDTYSNELALPYKINNFIFIIK
tara:strand:- start:2170 stop:2334 length:165 start_codon:yes stop_codon:yes gene_type:complete